MPSDLSNTWVLYDHERSDKDTYENCTRKIGSFSTVEGFWSIFNNYPLVSEIFNDGISKPVLGQREISALSLFKENIKPIWEDPMNSTGGEFVKRRFNKKNPMEEAMIDWENLVLSCIGENLDDSITGVRIIDSSVPNIYKKKSFKTLYRIEIWFSDLSKKDSIEKTLNDILNMDHPLNFKLHSFSNEVELGDVEAERSEA